MNKKIFLIITLILSKYALSSELREISISLKKLLEESNRIDALSKSSKCKIIKIEDSEIKAYIKLGYIYNCASNLDLIPKYLPTGIQFFRFNNTVKAVNAKENQPELSLEEIESILRKALPLIHKDDEFEFKKATIYSVLKSENIIE